MMNEPHIEERAQHLASAARAGYPSIEAAREALNAEAAYWAATSASEEAAAYRRAVELLAAGRKRHSMEIGMWSAALEERQFRI